MSVQESDPNPENNLIKPMIINPVSPSGELDNPRDENAIDMITQNNLPGELSQSQSIDLENHADPDFVGNSNNVITSHTSHQTALTNSDRIVTIPFQTASNQWSVLEIKQSDLNRNLGKEEQTLIKQVTDQLSLALENAHLFQQTQQLANELKILNEMARDLSLKLDIPYIAEVVYTHTSRLIELDFFSLSLFSEETRTLSFPFASLNGQRHTIEEKPFGNGINEYVINSQRPLLLSSHIAENYFTLHIEDDNPSLLSEIKSIMCVPLSLGDKNIGVIKIYKTTSSEKYSDHHLSLLISIANQSAIALENARSYELVQQALKEMRELDLLKSQFLANMSHELRTPLNSIIGFSKVILKGIDGPITELQEQDLNAIFNSGHHLLRLINDILDFSKMDANKMELAFEDVNLTELLEAVIPTIGGLIKDKPISIIKEIPSDLPVVHADPIRIRQVVINLLSNAAKFTDRGSITISAGTETIQGETSVKVKIVDTGLGISREDQEKLFQPFSQVDSSPTRKTGGTGLGLSISKKLIELHGGKIGVDSIMNEGSTFYFSLPIKRELK